MAEATVRVRRQWNDWRIATYKLSDLADVHWDTISGGVNENTPRPFLHGYVYCDGMIDGELSHSCAHGPGPHRIKVCVVKKDNSKQVIQTLTRQADG